MTNLNNHIFIQVRAVFLPPPILGPHGKADQYFYGRRWFKLETVEIPKLAQAELIKELLAL